MVRPLWSAVCALLLSVGLCSTAQADEASPSVSGPLTGGNGKVVLASHTTFDLASFGYAQSEYFVEGVASAYSSASALTPDGKWTVVPSSPAAFKTRMVVNRPADARKFNGSVVVEWLNVTGGQDISPDWVHAHVELIRQGFAWVGVSAQAVGVNALKTTERGDPVRYASLTHPGDSHSYDIFSQAGQAIRDNTGLVLGGLSPKRLLAVGESQSAGRLLTYINAAHPQAHVYDGFLVHSRFAAGANLTQAPLAQVPAPTPTFIRDDLDVPVLVFQTENDTGGLQARQPDSPRFRWWEVAGTAHFDQYGLQQGLVDTGTRGGVASWFDSMRNPTSKPIPQFTCDLPVNTGPQTYVLRAAVAHLDRWVASGEAPPKAPRFETTSIAPAQYVFDANGNVRGGIRTPAVDAPVAKLSGLGQTGTGFCFLLGTTTPLSPEQLKALYSDRGGFVRAWSRATSAAATAGFLRPQDALQMLAVGAQSDVLK